jgi:hypothetical protein
MGVRHTLGDDRMTATASAPTTAGAPGLQTDWFWTESLRLIGLAQRRLAGHGGLHRQVGTHGRCMAAPRAAARDMGAIHPPPMLGPPTPPGPGQGRNPPLHPSTHESKETRT